MAVAMKVVALRMALLLLVSGDALAAAAPAKSPPGRPDCTKALDCASGVCLKAVGGGRRFCGCTKNAECGPLSNCVGNNCVLKKYAPKPCTLNSDCMSGKCTNKQCTCLKDFDCDNASYCNIVKGKPNTCIKFKLYGAKCASKRECRSNVCIKGACRDCTNNAFCPCNLKTNTCQQVDMLQSEAGGAGSACGPKVRCQNNMPCLKGRCVCRGAEDCVLGDVGSEFPGPEVYDYRQGRCRKAVDPANQICLGFGKLNALPNGCSEDATCPSNVSNYLWHQEFQTCAGKTCVGCAQQKWVYQDCAACQGPFAIWCDLKTYRRNIA